MVQSAAPPNADRTGAAQSAFDAAARAAGYDPENKWIGGYVDYEWDHLRPLLAIYGLDLAPQGRPLSVLEFGCNVGASTVVMAALGGQVTAIDIDESMIRIARANIDRHAVNAEIVHVGDTRQLPFADASFDLVIANSVLEYVARDQLSEIVGELHRVTAPNGRMFVCGTASRLSPREVHSGRWFVNFLPHALDQLLFGKTVQRGLSPALLARTLKGRFRDETGDRWRQGRIAIHGGLSLPVRLVMAVAGVLGISPGWLSPNIELLLRRAN